MNKVFLFCLLLLITFQLSAQAPFEKGYFITNQGERVDCFIKNKDWDRNPRKFLYRTSTSKEKKEAIIDSIQEFGIYDYSKYVRFTVEVDTSTSKLEDMSYEKQPLFETNFERFTHMVVNV